MRVGGGHLGLLLPLEAVAFPERRPRMNFRVTRSSRTSSLVLGGFHARSKRVGHAPHLQRHEASIPEKAAQHRRMDLGGNRLLEGESGLFRSSLLASGAIAVGNQERGDATILSFDDEGLRNAIVGRNKVTFRRPLTTTIAVSSAWWFVRGRHTVSSLRQRRATARL